MLLGFKRRFAPHIQDGSKTHTIRAKRKLRPKAGETCHCYTGLRQKGARLLGRWRCVRVQDIIIDYLGIWVDVAAAMNAVFPPDLIDGREVEDAA